VSADPDSRVDHMGLTVFKVYVIGWTSLLVDVDVWREANPTFSAYSSVYDTFEYQLFPVSLFISGNSQLRPVRVLDVTFLKTSRSLFSTW
jgi:hypothetical protein